VPAKLATGSAIMSSATLNLKTMEKNPPPSRLATVLPQTAIEPSGAPIP
jgi:hypothetical protein